MNYYESLDEMCQYYSHFYNVQSEIEDIGEVSKFIDKEVDESIDILEQIINELRINTNKKPFLKIIDDYYIKVGDDCQLIDLHKPSDIRSLIYIINREMGFTETECENNERKTE